MSDVPDGMAEFAAFYDRHSAAVLSFFTRRTWDAEAAMDLTAETFAQAFAGRRSFRGSSAQELEGWLFAIARHQLSRFVRTARAERSAVQRLGMQVPRVAGDDLERIEELADLDVLRAVVSEQLMRLSGEHRQALTLRIVEGLAYDVIASRLEVSEQTARKRVSRALLKLADAVERGPAVGELG